MVAAAAVFLRPELLLLAEWNWFELQRAEVELQVELFLAVEGQLTAENFQADCWLPFLRFFRRATAVLQQEQAVQKHRLLFLLQRL